MSENDIKSSNTSGHGRMAEIPPGVSGWSFASFFLNWIWGIGNSVYSAFLVFIPFFGFIYMFILAAKGREWAWRNKRWDSVEHFRRVQRIWNWVALGVLALMVVYFIAIHAFIKHKLNTASVTAYSISYIENSSSAQTLLGDNIHQTDDVTGSIKENSKGGVADLVIPLTGTKASGAAEIHACQAIDKVWHISDAKVVTGEQQVDLAIEQNSAVDCE